MTDWHKQLVTNYEWSHDEYPTGKDKKRVKKRARTLSKRDLLRELDELELADQALEREIMNELHAEAMYCLEYQCDACLSKT